MQRFLKKATEFFDIPLDLKGRFVVLAGAILLIPTFFFPLWQFKFESERYPSGLSVRIYSHMIEGGSESDLLEINALNHYLGMRSIEEEDIAQFRWLPFLLGLSIMIALRVIVLGKMSKLIDLFFLVVYLGIFSFWSFYDSLYTYGHRLNPFAAVQIEPFTPPLFGKIDVAQIQISSAPCAGAYFLVLAPLVFLLAIWLARRTWVGEHQPRRDYIG